MGNEKTTEENKDWVLIISRDLGEACKHTLTNKLDKSLEKQVYRQHQRFCIPFNGKEAKSAIGITDYQRREWIGWHHHTCMSSLGWLFVTKEKIRLGVNHAPCFVQMISLND